MCQRLPTHGSNLRLPKADNTFDGHCPQKRLFVGEDFVPGHPQACLSALGSQARTVLSLSNMGRLWVRSYISKWSTSLMPYKRLAQSWVYHYYTWGQNRADLAPQSRQTSLRVARNKILSHNNLNKLSTTKCFPNWSN